jgi:heme exporter protein B
MLLMGVIVGLVFSLQMDLLPGQKQRMVGAMLWLALFFAGMTAVDRSFASEREDGCWEGLTLYPISPVLIYLAKLSVNVVALAVLQCLLFPLFFILAGVPLSERIAPLLLVASLGNVGIAAVATLLSALATGLGRNANLLVVLVLPLIIPVILAGAEATRLLADNQINDAWWRWVQLLGAFAVVYVTAGTVLFEHTIEE